MKNQRIFVIISLLLTGIALFAALPALVKACTEPSEENDWCVDPGFDAVDTYGWTELEVEFD